LENYRDVNRSLFGKKEDLEQRITIISSKEEQIVEEIQAAFEAEKGLEKNYFDKYSKSITQLEGQINEKFQSAEIGFSANIMLHGGIEDLGITVNTTFKNENGESITRNLTALSGGQRSMVGICLMLSLHQLKPSPFNIYDEIEMFLDPSNAQTVARLIHQLTQNGLQFVLLMPDKSKTLIQLADKVIGVCKNGKHGCSMLLNCEPNVC